MKVTWQYSWVGDSTLLFAHLLGLHFAIYARNYLGGARIMAYPYTMISHADTINGEAVLLL